MQACTVAAAAAYPRRMNGLKLVIGSRYASSWSLRPWLLLKQLGLPFEEIVIPLRQPDTALHIRRYSPSGKVPVLLVDGPAHLGLAGDRRIPGGAASRPLAGRPGGTGAGARGLLRDAQRLCRPAHLPAHGLHRPLRAAGQAAGVGRGRHRPDRHASGPIAGAPAAAGPFLFGQFTIADAMFAPVCSRFATYAVPLTAPALAYVEHMMDLPAMQEWGRLAHAELTRGESMPASLPDAEPARATPEPIRQAAIVAADPLPMPTVPEPEPCDRSPEPEPAPEPSPLRPPFRRSRHPSRSRRHRPSPSPRCRASRRPSCGAGRGRSRPRSWSSP